MLLIKEEIAELSSKFDNPRRTEISIQEALDFNEEDLIPHQSMVVTLSDRGFVKRVPSKVYTLQHRGGKGIIGMVTREQDAVRFLVVADTHDNLLFFTDKGKVLALNAMKSHPIAPGLPKGWRLLTCSPFLRGRRLLL